MYIALNYFTFLLYLSIYCTTFSDLHYLMRLHTKHKRMFNIKSRSDFLFFLLLWLVDYLQAINLSFPQKKRNLTLTRPSFFNLNNAFLTFGHFWLYAPLDSAWFWILVHKTWEMSYTHFTQVLPNHNPCIPNM